MSNLHNPSEGAVANAFMTSFQQGKTKRSFGHSRDDESKRSVSSCRGSHNESVIDSTASNSPSSEPIFIPQEARGQPLTAFSISVRLRNILLGRKKLRLAGDLCGFTFSDFLRCRNCGKKTVNELRELVNSIQHSHQSADSQAGIIVQESPPPLIGDAFFIPTNLYNLNVSDLPLSVRLEGVLVRKKVRHLGDLHGVTVSQLRAVRSCGRKTILELIRLINRARAGEFSTEPESTWNPPKLVCALDTLIADLPNRDAEILVERLGGASDEIQTLEQIGAKFRLTRERVRQIVKKSVKRIRKAGSYRLKSYIEQVEKRCCETVCPLTPALLKLWLKQASTCRFNIPFYVRLLGELSPAIPSWSAGRDMSAIQVERGGEIEQELKVVLHERFQSLPLSGALHQLQTKVSLRNLKAIDFLAALQHFRSFKIDFPEPDAPVVRLARRVPFDVAKAVLQASNSPMSPEEILARAQSIFGPDIARWTTCTIEHALVEDKGFYLLGRRSYGLRQHFSLPERMWEQAAVDFRGLLKQQNRPVSTVEVINHRCFDWAAQTNTNELACILREDKKLIDLGRFLFALAEWGIEERQYVKDLIPKVLQKAGRPLTATEVVARLQQLRSVSPQGISSCLRKHREVRDYGFSHFGLKSWGDSVKASIVTDVALIQRIIRRAEPPLTFARLCGILGISTDGELADALWQTSTVMGDVLRIPESRTDTGRLIHKSCRLERAVVATAREVNRPLPLYEFQWELNERFGPLFATKSLDELRRCLEQSTMFIRNAAGEFILDIHLDQLGLDADSIRRCCAAILLESSEIVGCEDLLERLEADGKSWEELSPDILASLLRDDPIFQEVGHDRFRVQECKH
jgi:Sigma-70, region 4